LKIIIIITAIAPQRFYIRICQ